MQRRIFWIIHIVFESLLRKTEEILRAARIPPNYYGQLTSPWKGEDCDVPLVQELVFSASTSPLWNLLCRSTIVNRTRTRYLPKGLISKRGLDFEKFQFFKYSVYILLWIFCSNLSPLMAKLPIRIDSSYAVLMDESNGRVIFDKKMDTLVYPASTTKLATALFVLSLSENLEEKIIASKESLRSVSKKYKEEHLHELPPYILQNDGTSFGIIEKEELSIESLLYGLLVSSGNDAANVLAFHFGKGNISAFMEEMNRYLAKIGLKKSHFCNPHGLHHKNQVTTPYEMAKIARLCLQNPLIAKIVSAKDYIRPKTNKQEERAIKQPNRLIASGRLHFEEALGMKTGYTANAGYCLVAAASNGKRSLVAAVFNAKDDKTRYRDAIEMFSEGFEEVAISRPLFNAKESLFFAKNCPVKAGIKEDICMTTYPSEDAKVESVAIFEGKKGSIAIGEQVGQLEIYIEGEKMGSYPLFARESYTPKRIGKRAVFSLIAGFIVLFCGIRVRLWLIAHRARVPT